jgi:phenylacetate-CoA ligase
MKMLDSPRHQNIPRYHESLDFDALFREFPPAPEYLNTTFLLSGDELHALQNERFLKQIERAWQVPFYSKRWGKAGLEKGDIRSLEDLKKIPPFSVHDFRESLTEESLWADYIGINPATDAPLPLILQTSGGTTGLPRPMIFAPRDREVMNLLSGRRFYMQGIRPFDLVQVLLSLGLSNGGLLAREGLWKYTGAVPVMTGSGATTPTRRQLELMQAWKVSFLVGFPAYLRHMALVARDELGIDPRELKIRGLVTHLGLDDRSSLEELWGAPAYDTYGINECGSIAAESEHRSGMHVFEDAFALEICDPDTMEETPAGKRGTIFVTSLFKYAAPMIRFNTNDISAFATGECPSGSHHRRITKIFGRSDNMVKLRGVNLFPESIGAVVAEDRRTNGEYVCILETSDDAGREDMTVQVEVSSSDVSKPELQNELVGRLKEVTGLKLRVEAVERGALDALTGLSNTSKIKRLIDRRMKVPAEGVG